VSHSRVAQPERLRQQANIVQPTALFLAFGGAWLGDLASTAWFVFVSSWLFAAIMLTSFAAVRHADSIAAKLGEPLGTLVLTMAITVIEATVIVAVMWTGEGNAALARDAMFAVIMIVLNGMVGLSLLLGGLRFHEQSYNLQGANAFLAVIVPLAVLGLVLPNFTVTTPGPTLAPVQAGFLIFMSVALYGVFLAIQNLRHREYFIDPAAAADTAHGPARSLAWHVPLLLVYLVVVMVLAKQLALPINHGIHVLHAPAALGGFLVSVLVLAPESLSAARAARANQLQRSVNLLLGSVLASISLTIPAVLAVGLATGQTIVLGLGAADATLLVLTLAVSTLTFASARSNVLLGAVHLLLFVAYVVMIFDK
jgi:Ca2+:H+ antiporter